MRLKYDSNKFYLVLILLVFLLIVGCKNDPRVSRIEKELETAKKQIVNLEKQVEKIRQEKEFDQTYQDLNKIAFLKTGSEAYTTVEFDLGVLTVAIKNVMPYANGSKVTLMFGNILSSTINGLKAKIDYGRVDEKGRPVNSEAKSKEVIFNQSLSSGAWTDVSVILDGIPSEKLGFVMIRDVSYTGIRLLKQ
jgi:outer membrane murein-binding lipoprotein Lpp